MGLKSLRGICWDFSLPDIAVQYISKSSLRRLDLGMNVDKFAQALGNPSAAAFLDLEDLELKVSDLGRAVFNLLRVIPSSPLRNLSLHYHSQMIPEERDVCRFSQSLAISPWKHNLHTLSLQAPTDWSLSSDSTASIIRPLLMLSNIEAIYLDMTMVAGLDNTLLDDIAHAWPRLSKLQFRASRGPAGHQWRATLDGLVPIVQYCPHLEQLDLCLHAVTNSLFLSQRLEQRPVNKSIEYLDWGHSTIKNPAEVASFLFDIFPNLISIIVWTDDRLVMARWDEVRRLIAKKRKESLDALV
ncbi:hypothetical protein VKT23_002890 [Stygiomarasmius scandens]|uniref:Uncharacterized protein n=1 Tax=Marasmiellus scandens TaxID=2682957 RepID=A0ABR1JVG8_9AGAR